MIKIVTTDLKEILSKVSRCAGNDKNTPLTQLLNIKSDGEKVTFTTTDTVNTCVYEYKNDTAKLDEMNVTVTVDQFNKLVSKFTCAEVSFGIGKSKKDLTVKGNGEYKLPIAFENGEIVEYPIPNISAEPASEIFEAEVGLISNAAKKSEGAITKVTPDIQLEDYPRTNYYFDSTGCVTLDGFKATWVKGDKLLPFTTLVYPSTIKLLSIFGVDDKIKAYKAENGNLIFKSENITLVSKEAQGIEAFPYEVAIGLIETEVEKSVDVTAGGFLAALDRLKLFMLPVDGNCVKLEFGENGLTASSSSGACSEQISSDNVAQFSCFVDVDNLISQLKSFGEEIVTIGYGGDKFMQLFTEEIGQIVVLTTEEDE